MKSYPITPASGGKKSNLGVLKYLNPAHVYLFKVNNRNTRKKFEICLKLTIKTPIRRLYC